jgi:hypothetical protein
MGAAMLVVGGAVAVAAVVAAPHLFRVARPYLREGLKHGLKAYDRARATAAELIDDVEDLVAEVRAEHVRPASQAAAASVPPKEAAGG